MTKRSRRRATGLAQVRALAHPLRLRLIELFALGPLTAKQAALKLGQPPTRLYHHVATLERAGLLRLARTRAVRGATEKYYEVARQQLRAQARSGAEALRGSTARDREAIGLALFDQARSELMRALETGALENKRPLMAIRAVARVTPQAARRLHRDLVAVLKRLQQEQREQKKARVRDGASARPRRELERYALTIALVPKEDEAS